MSIQILPHSYLEENYFQKQINDLTRQKRELIVSLSGNYLRELKLRQEIAGLQGEIILLKVDSRSTMQSVRILDREIEVYKRLLGRGQK